MTEPKEPRPDATIEKTEPEMTQSEYLRQQLDGAHHIDINKPFDQWTEEERRFFNNLLNNFCLNVPGGTRARDLPELESYDTPMKEGESPDYITTRTTGPLEWRLSEKYLNQTPRQFHEDIKQALTKSGINMDELAKKSKTHDENSRLWINLNSLPAIFDLLESGYTLYDLTG
ncbi:MAG: hypothetical protein NTY04_03315 [Candidatus Staskawiczbacteria bacterium]|nr:hypothetical protein [Candidatus Staskawiczbacteria bacterium]